MKLINEYAISIIIASLLAILLEHLLPEDNSKKYTGTLIGLFIMLVILNPLSKLPHLSHAFTIPTPLADAKTTPSLDSSFIAESFEQTLAQTITEDVQKEYGTTIRCHVRCSTNSAGQILGIRSLTLSPASPDIVQYISEKYDIKEVQTSP